MRFDDDDDANNMSPQGGGGHGNTKLPFGLCQREGIKIDPNWAPKDAWNALEGKGYSAKEAYKELRETGKVSPKTPKAPAKTPAEIKKMGKTVSDLQRAMKKREKLEKDQAAANHQLSEAINSKVRYESASERYKKMADEILQKYGSEENIPSKSERERGYPPLATYQLYRDNERSYARDAENIGKTIPELTKKTEDISRQLSAYPSKEEHKRQYDQAVDELLSNSPYTKRVHDFRAIEEESEDARKNLAEAQRKVEEYKSSVEYFEGKAKSARDIGDEESAKFFESHGLEASRRAVALHESHVETFSKQVAEYDRRMNEAKGDATDKDWKQIYELSVGRDTVQNGPYTKLQSIADSLAGGKVQYLNPVKYINTPTEEKIVQELGGPDKTRGSCASLAFAFFANKAGYKVLDFRGGKSWSIFAYKCGEIIEAIGGKHETGFSPIQAGMRMLAGVEDGKEYYFMTGRHAAAVRKKNGKLQYLELQSGENGWRDLDEKELISRFNRGKTTSKRRCHTALIEASRLFESDEVISLMGYINTASDKQKKGAGGGVK